MAAFPGAFDGDNTLLVASDFISTRVRADMTNVQATIPVNSAASFPNPAGATYYVVIDAATSTSREICGYTGVDLTGGANALTGVTRNQGVPATGAFAHLTGVSVELNIVSPFHTNLKSAMVAVQTKIGIDGSAVSTTLDYKNSEVTGGDKAVGKTATQTLTNKTLTTPTLTGPTITGGMTVSGASTITGTLGGITTLTATTLSGTLSTAAQGNITSLGTLTSLTLSGAISGVTTLTATTLAGTLSTAAQANVTSLGTLTTLTVASLITVSAGGITVTGASTITGTLGGITTLTATTLAGTLSTAAQPNVTSLGTLTALTVSTGAVTVSTAGNATFNRQYLAAKFAAGNSSTAITLDWNNGNVQAVTMTGACTLTLNNPISGGRYLLVLTQDGTGGRAMTWPAAVKWTSGVAPTLSGANKADVVGMIWDGTNYYASVSLNY